MNNLQRVSLMLTVCLFSGCLSRAPMHSQTFEFAIPSAPARNIDLSAHRVLAVRRVRVAAPFESRTFIYRTGEYSYESDPYAEFLAPCEESLLYPIRGWLRQCGYFETVIEAGSAVKPNAMLEITATELYGDFRNPREADAVIALKLTLLDASNGIPGKLVFEREYSRRLPLKSRTASNLMAGWDEALDQMLAQFGEDVRDLQFTTAHESNSNK